MIAVAGNKWMVTLLELGRLWCLYHSCAALGTWSVALRKVRPMWKLYNRVLGTVSVLVSITGVLENTIWFSSCFVSFFFPLSPSSIGTTEDQEADALLLLVYQTICPQNNSGCYQYKEWGDLPPPWRESMSWITAYLVFKKYKRCSFQDASAVWHKTTARARFCLEKILFAFFDIKVSVIPGRFPASWVYFTMCVSELKV